jgi:hypothetical protein
LRYFSFFGGMISHRRFCSDEVLNSVSSARRQMLLMVVLEFWGFDISPPFSMNSTGDKMPVGFSPSLMGGD